MQEIDRLRHLAGLNESDEPRHIPAYRQRHEANDWALTDDERANHLHMLTDVKKVTDAIDLWLRHQPGQFSNEDHQLINQFTRFLGEFMYPMALLKSKKSPGLSLRR